MAFGRRYTGGWTLCDPMAGRGDTRYATSHAARCCPPTACGALCFSASAAPAWHTAPVRTEEAYQQCIGTLDRTPGRRYTTRQQLCRTVAEYPQCGPALSPLSTEIVDGVLQVRRGPSGAWPLQATRCDTTSLRVLFRASVEETTCVTKTESSTWCANRKMGVESYQNLHTG